MQAIQALEQRFSANHFDTNKPVTEKQIEQLVYLATQAPSAFNIQHTRLLAVVEPAAKAALKAVAFNQQKVEDAAVTFVVLADTQAHEHYARVNEQAIEAGLYDQQMAEKMLEMVAGNYADKPGFSRDEALRSGSMVAMNLMTAATAVGLASGPMIGFDPKALQQEFKIAERYLPVMMIAVGYEGAGNWPKKPRLTTEEVLVKDARPGQTHPFSQ
ncbi:Nitroreductase [Marinospirillum celere]|uniref:Nitroreductase n=1 Tax=Marinospirillum celere TaxID=1122252 RepID=A0A1I1GQL3_9GAMM|nr:nitroreductase family protein [Marinospirillum celere]SFC13791.1 Nitroreductase [Marinospirillum celere]